MVDTGFSTMVSVQKAPTRGGSKNRHTRAKVYCDCDHRYTALSDEKKKMLEPWWKAVKEHGFVSMSSHSIWMKCCLKYMEECPAFEKYSYVSRFNVYNETPYNWVNEKVILSEIPTYQTDGWDAEAFKLLLQSAVKNRILYETYMIDYRLVTDVTTRGKVIATIPSLGPGQRMLVDVYSYYRGD